MLRTWIFRAHCLVGISAGLVLASVGATGALLALSPQILDRVNAQVRTVQPQLSGRSILELLHQIAQASHGAGQVRKIRVPSNPASAVRIEFGYQNDVRVRYLDPYTGRFQDRDGTRGEAFFD